MEPISPLNRSPIQGVKELLIGGAGTGKTLSLATWLDAEVTPFCIFTEPTYSSLGKKLDEMHWAYRPPGTVPWADLIRASKLINTLTYQQLCKLDDINKRQFDQFISFLTLNNNFKCEHCNKEFGDVDSWGTDRVLVWDSLSGLSYMAKTQMVGSKPVMDQGDYGVAMDNLESVIRKAVYSTRCHFVLVSHLEPERNEVTGTSDLMASTLGRKLAPKLPQLFNDVIITHRTVDKFTWSVIDPGTQAVARHLPFRADLVPSFVPVVEAWKARGGIIEHDAKQAA